MRCPTCDATNPDGAAFCGQCLRRFAEPTPAPTSSAQPSTATAADWLAQIDAAAPPSPQAPSPATPAQGAGDGATRAQVGRFAAEGGELRWTCAVCGTEHPFGQFTCSACGARMDAEAPDPDATPVDWDRARQLEAVVPGLGHLQTGHTGMGIARAGITAIWLIGSLLLAGGGVSGLLTALPLIVGMGVIWVTGPGDLQAARLGRSPRLDARRFMYLVVAATTGVIIAGGVTLLA